MSQQDVEYISSLCQELYNPKNPSEREQVQKLLESTFPTFSSSTEQSTSNLKFNISTPTDTANALRILLENSPNPYVQIFSFSRLKQLVMAQFTIFDKDTKLQLRTFLLEYAYIHPDLQPFVITQLASVLSLLTKFGWLDMDEYQQVYKDMNQFLNASADHRIVGLQILSVIIQDMNSNLIIKYAAKFRKAAVGLRDTQLFDIFETAYKLLEGILNKSLLFDKPYQENRTIEVTLDLILKCLSYDFAGTTSDEAGEDTGMVQIPSSWRSVYEHEDFITMFFKAYGEFTMHAKKAMECLVQIAATRKGLFSGQESRSQFIQTMMQGIQDIILYSKHLEDPDCYHEFCRLLHRFRSTAPLNEMIEKQGYLDWIQLVANFTQSAFLQSTNFYLLSFWSRIVQSMNYYQQLPELIQIKLQDITINITKAFITSCIDNVSTRIEEMLDDPLDDEEALVESLNMLGQIARCKYDKSCDILFQVFDPITLHYQELITQSNMGTISEESFKEANQVFEAKFTWLIYIMAVFVGNRPPYLGSDESDEADGKIITKVIQLMQVSQLEKKEKLDLAIVYFFTQYRKSYVGETDAKATYDVLNDVFGIEHESDMLNLIMRKIITHLQVWGESEVIIHKTLELFNDLASGYSALRNLRKIDSTKLIMQSHSSNDFFMNHSHKQNRMLYYQVLCKILFAEDDCEQEFLEFMKPFEMRLNELSMLNTVQDFQQPKVQSAMENLFRDLRGFMMPISSRKQYLMFFNWFYPDYMPVLMKGIEAWSPNPSTNTLLKFFGEFVYNKSQRLNFDPSSPNGILLFKDASQILCTFGKLGHTSGLATKYLIGQGILNMQVTQEKYPMKYKGISSCFNIFMRCLGGKYINFGVFWLYGDKSLNKAISIIIDMMLNIPLDDMMKYPKLTKQFFMLLDEFSLEQMMENQPMSPEAFLYIMEACELGVQDPAIRAHACSVVNHICTFIIQKSELEEIRQERQAKKSVDNIWFLNYFSQFPQVLPKLLSTIFGMILFDDNHDQWHLSRPLYTLVLLERDFASKYTSQVILRQLPERREFITKALSNLMEGSGWTLNTKDRERFSQQVAGLKRELNNHQIVLVPN